MLVISRKKSESVLIGYSGNMPQMLKVTVLEIRGGRVRLGFDADAAIRISRAEIGKRISAAILGDNPIDDMVSAIP